MADNRQLNSEQQLDIFARFALELVNIVDKEQLLWLVSRQVVSKLGFVDCVIYEVVSERNCMIQKAAFGIKNPFQEEIINRIEIPIGRGVTGRVAELKKPMIIKDASLEDDYIIDVENNLSEIAVPIIYDGHVYGVIDCEDPRRDYFGPGHLRALKTIAAMLASKLLQFEINSKLETSNEALNEEVIKSRIIEKELEKSRGLLETKVKNRTSDLQSSIDELIQSSNHRLDAEAQVRSNQELLHQSAKMASIGILAAGIAHEINNPIAFVKSNLQSIEEMLEELAEDSKTKLDTKENESLFEFLNDLPIMLKSALDGTSRVIRIVSELKEYSHQDAENRSPRDVNSLIDKAVALARNELKYKVKVKLFYAELPKLNCWGDKLVQVFLNLIVNSAQAIENQGEINISTSSMNDSLIIRISDNGQGMSEETKIKMFDPFFTTKEVGVGTGLGMHISYKIIENHNGRIRVQSKLGEGTEISISIPFESEY